MKALLWPSCLKSFTKEHGKGAILHTHSSSHSRGLLVPRKTNTLAGQIGWEPSFAPVFPEGELPPPIPRADGVAVAAGTEIPLAEFLKLTKHPILLIWGDYIPQELDPANAGTVLEGRRIWLEQYKLFATVANKHGGNVRNVILPEVGVSGNTHYPMADTNIHAGIRCSLAMAEDGESGQVKLRPRLISTAST